MNGYFPDAGNLYFSHHWKLDSLSDRINGAGTLVAILSTGIQSEHIAFKHNNIVLAKNFVDDNPSFCEDLDSRVSGTALASVVAGGHIRSSPNIEKFVCESGILPVGVAPKASLVICRIIEKSSDINPEAVIKALQWIYDHNTAVNRERAHCDCPLQHYNTDEAIRDKNKIRIVLLSFKLERNVLSVGDLIDDLKKQCTVCVASCDESALYPAAYGNVLSVGSLDGRIDISLVSDNTVCAGPGNDFQTASGAIFSASAVIGLLALLLQCVRKHAHNRVTLERIMTVDVLRFLVQENLMERGSKRLVSDKVFKFFAYKLDNIDSIVSKALGL